MRAPSQCPIENEPAVGGGGIVRQIVSLANRLMGTGPPTDSSLEADPPGPLTEKRELQRTAVRYGVRVRFRRGEQEETVHGRIRDISNRGVCINADVEFTKGTLLFLDVPQLRLTGCGKVRHCAPRLWGFGGYSIGIQLNGPLYRSL